MSEDGYDSVPYEEASMELSIETLTGTTFEMTVYPTDNILDIKTKIQRVEGIPIHQQHLLYKLEELQDDDRLCDKRITEGATLRLVLSMRGGPISTRRLQLSDHHIAWKEIKEFVESTKENMVDKLPPGSKVTVLLFREGDTINLIRVIENENGTYSPLPCESSQRASKSSKKDESHTSTFKRFLENSEMLNKVSDLRKRMGDLSLKRQMKNSQPVEQEVDNSRFPDVNQPSTSGYIGQRRRERFESRINRHSSGKSISEKYSERILSMQARREAQAKAAAFGRSHRPHRVTTSAVAAAILVSNDQDSEEDLLIPTDYASPENVAASMDNPNEDKEIVTAAAAAAATNSLDKKIRRIATTKVPSSGVQLYVVQDPGERPKTAPQKYDQDAPDICDMVLNDQSELCNNAGGASGGVGSGVGSSVKVGMINRRQSLECASGVDYNNIGHLEYAEANLGAEEELGGRSGSLLTTANPDLSNQWSLKCLQMQQCYVSTASAIPPQYAPKDEPVVEEEPDRIYMNVKLPEPLHRHPRYPLYGRKTTRQSNIERIRNDKAGPSSADSNDDGFGCCNYGYSGNALPDKGSTPADASSELKRDVCGLSYVSNIERVGSTNCLHEFGIDHNRSSRDSHSQNSSLNSSHCSRSSCKSSLSGQCGGAISRKPSLDVLPPIVTKKRIRCGQCNKRLNITNVYNCPCGGIFCSQHRYSEVHGCHYDYKTEGRKLIEKANPLVTACKLPKI